MFAWGVLDRVLKAVALRQPEDVQLGLVGPLSFAPVRSTALFGVVEVGAGLAIILSVVVVLLALVLSWTTYRRGFLIACLGASGLAIGGLGNLIDRVAYGSVIDYVIVPSWQVFNLADLLVVVSSGARAYGIVRMPARR
jgi:signal peptidase II